MAANFSAIDFETTGFQRGYANLPWQVGIVAFEKTSAPICCFDTYLHVSKQHPFNAFTPGTHALHREEIAVAPSFDTLWPQLHRQLSTTYPVAHNAATERTLLKRFAPLTAYPWIDTLKLCKKAFPGLSSYALEDLCDLFAITSPLSKLCPRAPHDATYDAYACALLLQFILAQPGWSQLSADDLIALS